jgi:hypothetical protein
MRVLFTTHPGEGHFHPQVPLARALSAAGHEVAFACSPSFRPTIGPVGFRCFPAGLDWLEPDMDKAFPTLRQIPHGPEWEAWGVDHILAGGTAEALARDVLDLAREWQPDVIVLMASSSGAASRQRWVASRTPLAASPRSGRQACTRPFSPGLWRRSGRRLGWRLIPTSACPIATSVSCQPFLDS